MTESIAELVPPSKWRSRWGAEASSESDRQQIDHRLGTPRRTHSRIGFGVAELQRIEQATIFVVEIGEFRPQLGLGHEDLFATVVTNHSPKHELARRKRVRRNLPDERREDLNE